MRAFDSTVAIGIGLYDGAYGYARTYMLLHRSKVLSQRCERDVRPRGTRCRAAKDFSCGSQWLDYSESCPPSQVTQGLLPSEILVGIVVQSRSHQYLARAAVSASHQNQSAVEIAQVSDFRNTRPSALDL
jgi:hypothetical protein